MKRLHFTPRKWLRQWLGIDAVERFAVKYALRQSGVVDKLHHEIGNIRATGFMGVDMGYQEKATIILLHYDCINDAWKVIHDVEFESKNESYANVIRSLRVLVEKYNVKFFAQHTPSVIVPLKARIGLVEDAYEGAKAQQDLYDQIPRDVKIDEIAREAGLLKCLP